MVPKTLNRPTRIILAVGLLLPLLLIAVPAFVAYRAQAVVNESSRWITHTLEVEGAIQSLVNSLVDAETGQRGFLLTGREPYLEPYEAGIARVGQQLNDLRNLTLDNASQQQRLTEVEPLIRERLELLARTVASERSGDHEGAIALVNSGRGKFVMDKIRGVLRVMGDEEHRLLWIRQQAFSKHARRNTVLLWLMVVGSGAIAAALFYLMRRLSRIEPLVNMCAVSNTIEYKGEWLSFEEYLQRRFGLSTSVGLSPAEFEKVRSQRTSGDGGSALSAA